MIRTVLGISYLALGIIFILPWLILWSAIVGNADFMYATAMKAVRVALPMVGIRVRIEGVENIPPGACIFAANHASNLDPTVLLPSIPRRVSVLVKKELFRIPIFATAMRQGKIICLDRADRIAAISSVDLVVQCLKEGISFLIFAEGTRSHDGRLKPFKKGAFMMAILAGVPVVPVSISGTQRLLRKGDWRIQPGDVVIRFGPAVDASQYTMNRRPELLKRVEALVAAALPEDQRSLPSR